MPRWNPDDRFDDLIQADAAARGVASKRTPDLSGANKEAPLDAVAHAGGVDFVVRFVTSE